jgi:hypothetical protein
MKTSPDTLLRVIGQTVLPTRPTPRVLGVDDWAMRRGKVYGTMLVDLERQRPIELLTDRSAETLAAWLRAHPGGQIISRDRSTEYAGGASDGAPQAPQVADRWHLLKNLREAVERMLSRLRPELEKLPIPPMSPSAEMTIQHAAFDSTKPSRQASKQASRARRYECYQAVRRLAAHGIPEVHSARQRGLARATVRQFARSLPAVSSPAVTPRLYGSDATLAGDSSTGISRQSRPGCPLAPGSPHCTSTDHPGPVFTYSRDGHHPNRPSFI